MPSFGKSLAYNKCPAVRRGDDSDDSDIEMLRRLDRAILLPHGQHDEHQMDDHDKSAGFRQGPRVSPLDTGTGGLVQTRR
ncbi:hypothetical protein ABVK25_001626 [Lepraria finkii]|uniref:Uncharacterized protein n=1 Tax=Lepraria finkii TaxID=1340010 RepID=A0ABR4BK05_9LECA